MLIKRIGSRAGLPLPVHAHMLRHAHTTRYTQLSAAPFKDYWR